jgi:hypothetical protein
VRDSLRFYTVRNNFRCGVELSPISTFIMKQKFLLAGKCEEFKFYCTEFDVGKISEETLSFFTPQYNLIALQL